MKKTRPTEKNKLSNGSGKNNRKKRKKGKQTHDRPRKDNSSISEVEEYNKCNKSSSSLAASIFGSDIENAEMVTSLSSSIFGSNAFDATSNGKDDGGDKQGKNRPGSNPKLGSLENLFSSSRQLEQIDDRVKKNLDRMVSNDGHSIGEQCKDSTTSTSSSTKRKESVSRSSTTKKTRLEIIKCRKGRCTSKDAIELTESITVQAPNLSQVSSSASLDGEDGSELAEIRRGMENMFTIQCDSVMRENGVLIIQSAKRAVKKNSHMSSKSEEGIIPTAIMESMSDKACAIEKKVCSRLDEKGIIIHAKEHEGTGTKRKSMGSTRTSKEEDNIETCTSSENLKNEVNHSFQYHEVASRCLGRLDIRYNMDQYPFNKNEVVSNSFITPVVQSLLGKDAKLVYAGLILSFPHSADQPWHQDGTSLFGDQEFPVASSSHLPPYALNIFVPLEDVTVDLGPTEFCVGSHYRETALKVMEHLRRGDETSAKVIGPLLKAGDALIYDYRICHRGTQNLSKAGMTRPMLYLMYARPWFNEHINFGHDKLFA
uniref:Phytanoyl-CoA dioxygenase n=1 Tax=Chaetoceros debilis TaxID=122233 RepID=A0A7S3V7Q1_9STRA